MRDLLIPYVFRPLARVLSRLFVRLAALPALQLLFRHVPAIDRLNDEIEKDLAEWFRGSLLLLLVTANMEQILWQRVVPFRTLLDRHEWLGIGLRIMLAIAVIQLMPDQEFFTVVHPGPRLPRMDGARSWWERVARCWKPIGVGFVCQHLSRSSPVFAILAVILDGTTGWVCYSAAIVQYLIIGLATSRDRAIDVLTVFDEKMTHRRRELLRQQGVIDEFRRRQSVFNAETSEPHSHSSCGD